jgi:hypothetical protein
MDDFFWGALINNVIHAFLIIGLGFVALFLLVRYYLKNKPAGGYQPGQEAGVIQEDRKTLLPLRLQACERLVLFLERIHPQAMLVRLVQPGMSAQQLQVLLVSTIREEFEYNLSQQIYISPTTWDLIRSAREETARLVNRAAAAVPGEEPANTLASAILEMGLSAENDPVAKALDAVKKEVRSLF